MCKSTAPMPSTNIPIVCPLCEPELADTDHMAPGSTARSAGKKRLARIRQALMKYNLTAHWQAKHSESAMPLGLQRALQLAPNESALLAVNQGGKVSASQVQALTTSGVLK